jgi:hypothetical protein
MKAIHDRKKVPLEELLLHHEKSNLTVVHHYTLKNEVIIGLDKSFDNYHSITVILREPHENLKVMCDELYNLSPEDCHYAAINSIPNERFKELRKRLPIGYFSNKLHISFFPWYINISAQDYEEYLVLPNRIMPHYKMERKFNNCYSIQFWDSPTLVNEETESHLKAMSDFAVAFTKSIAPPPSNYVPIPSLNHTDYISARYDKLFILLGKPGLGDGYKTDAWWIFELEDGTKGEIHNYKNGKNYLGEQGVAVEHITEWTIRTLGELEMAKVLDYLKANDILIR